MKTLKAFVQETYIPEALVRAVVRQAGGWRDFREIAEDIARHGANAGFSGFVYYRDTVAFTRRNIEDILAHAQGQALEYGATGTIDFLQMFQCLKGYSYDDLAEGLYNPRSEYRDTVYNALAWFALEECSRAYVDLEDR
jgi:hypothetical protein